MNIDEKFKVIKELLAEGYDGSISEYIQQIEQQEQQQQHQFHQITLIKELLLQMQS